MSKEFSFPNSGTCSKQTNFVLNDDHTIASMEVIGGCNGNLKGICRLVKGMKAEDVIDRMEGTLCGFRNTSCPDQIAKNLKKALAELYPQKSHPCRIARFVWFGFFVDFFLSGQSILLLYRIKQQGADK